MDVEEPRILETNDGGIHEDKDDINNKQLD
jgi:hypothetical protein